MDSVTVRQALLSVFDKTGVVDLAKALVEHDCHILSTGGTGSALTEAGITYQEVSDYTGSPEMLGGRVKTLHPKIHGGILYKREDDGQVKEAGQHGVKPIDLVAVNLYPFQETVAKPEVTLDEAAENIDIGGPAMIRAAAKNFQSVVVVTSPDDYSLIIDELKNNGGISFSLRRMLAAKAFLHTSQYDDAITNYLQSIG